MTHYSEIKRKHARFPAFSDEEGVKKHSPAAHATFSSDESWILTEDQTDSLVLDQAFDHETKQLRRVTKTVNERAGHSIRQKDELSRHRNQLPDYRSHTASEVTKTGKPKLFGSIMKKAERTANNQVVSRQVPKPTKTKQAPVLTKSNVADRQKNQTEERTYFVPKYVPSSLIQDEPERTIDQKELYESMKKAADSYMLFDTSDYYKEKKVDEPSVKRFQSNEEIAMTRGEYKAAIKSKEKKRTILDRSLKGLIEDGQSQLSKNGYFKN